ncbi:MAG: hypothetical protein PHY74_00525 [Candidatus Bathyarchaeota archaeon]|nr:hypothetical protein [Candidatus Bathyarchaeota archaeon]MDD4324799.1 hypothetical protein [Candidatus Bathyarchaeota archaeon]MDI9576751.1 hypothetical protein [Thermoproteota archaeon]MDT8781446.1 hypothetical protein [Candidatus Bathyarchaeota archaeon]NLD65398.1 hypothetical protein [Thermoproteota archaeon]
MSFGNLKVFTGIQEMLILALMLISILALFYLDIEFTYKIGIIAIVFVIIVLSTMAAQLLRIQKENIKS